VPTIGLLSNHGSGEISASHRDLVECPPVAAFTTIMPDGYPQTSVVWCDFDGECVRVNTMRGFAKERNMRRIRGSRCCATTRASPPLSRGPRHLRSAVGCGFWDTSGLKAQVRGLPLAPRVANA
jgi:Pyridoxamine 5'-phosphate oxidase